MGKAGAMFQEDDLAALRLPIPIEGLEQTMAGLYILYGEPLVLRSEGRFLMISRPQTVEAMDSRPSSSGRASDEKDPGSNPGVGA